MHRLRLLGIAGAAGALILGASLVAPAAAFAAPVPATYSGTLYFTTRQNEGTCSTCTPNVFKVIYTYNPATPSFTLGSATAVATTKGADGIIFGPSGNLLVGGQANGNVYVVNPNGNGTSSAVISTKSSGLVGAYHLTLDPSGKVVWTYAETNSSTQPGMSSLPVNPLGTGTPYTVTGSDTIVTQFAYDPNNNTYYYTSSSWPGNGDYGYLTFDTTHHTVTTHKLGSAPAAHGIVYDPYTKDIIMVGANEISQFDPTTGSIVSTYTSGLTTGQPNENHFDQLAVDGQGHLFATWNGGNLVFIDYSGSGLVGAKTNFSADPFLNTNLDDIVNQLPEVPFAALMPLMLIPGILWFRRRRRFQGAA